ncbi:MAG: hypothetical protein L0Y58_14720, partial [Verrucomicrobia subdivision 3 bacterium]|nr:hypothetical protein [Limisphaerales bacterium]
NAPSGGGDMTIQLVATTNAPAFQGPLRLVITDAQTSEERVVPFRLTSRTEDNGVPGGYSDLLIDAIDHVWLTVRPKPEPSKEAAKK